MATLPGLQKGITKDPAPPATDTQLSPITIPNGTTLLTTKLHNEIVDNEDQIIDYISGDNSPNFIPQNAIATLVTDLSNKQPINSKLTEISGLTFLDDDIIQQKSGSLVNRTPIQFKVDLALVKADVGLGNVDNTSDADKPVSTAQQTALDGKEDSLGFTPEDSANKGAASGYAPLVTGLVPIANLGTGTPDGTKFLRDDGTFALPPGAGGGEVNTSSNAIADSATEKGLAKAKSGLDLPFRVVAIGSTNMSIASDADKVTVDVLPANLTGIPQSGITDLVTDLSNKQPLDADLTSIAGLTPTNDDIIQRKAGAWTNRTPIQFKVDLALVKADVGLSNVDNTSDADKPVSTAQQTALDGKEDSLGFTPENVANKVTSIGTPGNNTNYPTEAAVRTELDSKEDSLGFTPEDSANKNAVSGYAGLDASSKLTGSQQVYGSIANTAAEGNDSRLSDARTPLAHATSHKLGQSDPIKLDEFATPDDNTNLDATTLLHGLLPKVDKAKIDNGEAGKTFAKVIKLADETRVSTTTLADDSELLISLDANKTYGFIFVLMMNSPATPDLKYSFTIPTGASGGYINGNWISFFPGELNAITNVLVVAGGAVDGIAPNCGRIITDATAGDITLQWAQDVSDPADTTVLQGSYMVVWEE